MTYIIRNRIISIAMICAIMLACVPEGKANEWLIHSSTGGNSNQTQSLYVLAADAWEVPAISILNKHATLNSYNFDTPRAIEKWKSGTYQVVEVASFPQDPIAIRQCERCERKIASLELSILDQISRGNNTRVRDLKSEKKAYERLLKKWQKAADSKIAVYRLWNGENFCSIQGRSSWKQPVRKIASGTVRCNRCPRIL